MLLTVKDVAGRLNVSQSCIYQLVESGKIPHHRIGVGRGAIRFTEDDINEYLTQAVAKFELRDHPQPAKVKAHQALIKNFGPLLPLLACA